MKRALSERVLEVLVVDDSAVVRQFMTSVLGQDRHLHVTTASDPFIAMRKMRETRPDVMVLDLEMPRMDGLTFLRQIMGKDPLPVVICSGHAAHGTRNALDALSEGAVDIITKPRVGVREFLQESAVLLIDTIRAAAQARLRRRSLPAAAPPKLTADAILPAPTAPPAKLDTRRVVAVGASTGGPAALEKVIRSLSPHGPGLVVVQHMPAGFTAAFAQRLDRCCRAEVSEARDRDSVRPGSVLIAPGNRHMMLARQGGRYTVRLLDGPLVSRHRPSVDVLFRSTAQAAGPNAVGILMTGMGDDGVQGLLELREAGGATLAQDRSSSVVYGMPKEAVARGAAQEVLPLDRIAERIGELTASTDPVRALKTSG